MYLFSKVCTIEVGDDVSSIQSIPKKQQHKSTFPFFVLFPCFSFQGNISLVNVITLPPAPTFLEKCSGEVRWWCWLSFCSRQRNWRSAAGFHGGIMITTSPCLFSFSLQQEKGLLLLGLLLYMTATASSWSKWGCLQIIIFILGIEDINNHKSSW